MEGRDFYDFEWYIENGVSINRKYLANNLMREGLLEEPKLTREKLLEILRNRFETVDLESALADISSYVDTEQIPNNWDPEHFIELSQKIQFSDC